MLKNSSSFTISINGYDYKRMAEIMKKTLITAVILTCFATCFCYAQKNAFEATIGGYSGYIWRGIRWSEDHLTIQPSLSYSYNQAKLEVWSIYDTNTSEWLELDVILSYQHKFKNWSFETGYMHYNVNNGDNSDELFCEVRHLSALSPFAAVYYDFNKGNGAYVKAGIEPELEITHNSTMIMHASLSAVMNNEYMITNADGSDFAGLFTGELFLSAEIFLSDNVFFTPVVGHTYALSQSARFAVASVDARGRDRFLYAGISIGVLF